MKNHLSVYITGLALLLLAACSSQPAKKTAEPLRSAAFSADSAYRFINEQVNFGARVPGTPAHEACAKYLMQELRRHGARVEMQQGTRTNYAGEEQPIVNIVGQYGDPSKEGVLLCAHWDCRPWSDQEEDYSRRSTPVLGANDGASGVGVLLEIARQLGLTEACPSVTIVFFDVEDMGTPEFYTGIQRENTWCLGSQLWAERYKKEHSCKFRYGILLDMVASPDASFPLEYFSEQYAAFAQQKVWKTASNLGYGRFFKQERSYPLTDDHYYVNTIAGIPCIDIIHYDQRSGTGFPEYWHTNHDDMKNVSVTTLDAVGKTVLTTILQ